MKTLTLNNRTFLAWKVPHVDRRFKMFCTATDLFYNEGPYTKSFSLPPGTYSEPFLLSQVDEERAKGMVENIPYTNSNGSGFEYPDYTTPKIKFAGKEIWSIVFLTALESFHSWMRANGVFVVNPMGEIEPAVMDIDRFPLPICMEPREEQKELYLRSESIALIRKQWTDYQSQVSKEWVLIEQLTSK